jgi:hypothetical protein
MAEKFSAKRQVKPGNDDTKAHPISPIMNQKRRGIMQQTDEKQIFKALSLNPSSQSAIPQTSQMRYKETRRREQLFFATPERVRKSIFQRY